MSHTKGKRLKKQNIALLGGGVLLAGCAVWFGWNLTHPVRFIDNDPQVELESEFSARNNIRSVFLGSADDVQISSQVDTSVPGDYMVEYTYKNHTYKITVSVADFTPPELELRSITADIDEELDAESFVVSCTDISKVSITIDNPENLRNEEGVRSIAITAMDEFGNKTTKYAQLTRLADTSAPVIHEEEGYRVFVIGSDFEPADLTITDNTDTECSVDINTGDLDMFTAGSYEVIYTISDGAGNSTTWKETIRIVDTWEEYEAWLEYGTRPEEVREESEDYEDDEYSQSEEYAG